MSEDRTPETVRAELQLVRRRIRVFETTASQGERLGMAVRHFIDVVDKITPDGLRGTFGVDNVSAFLVADALEGIKESLRCSPDLAGHLQSLDRGTEGLLRQLYEQEDSLEQELAKIKPAKEAGPVGFWRRLQRLTGSFNA